MHSPTLPPPDDANRETLRLFIGALIVAGVVVILHFTPLKQWLSNIDAWKQWLDQFGWKASLAFFVASSVASAVGVSRLVLAAGAGTLFGISEGFVVAMFSGLAGSYVTFLAARRGSSQKLRDRVHASDSLRKLLAKPTLLKIFFVRQLPVPAIAPNVILGLMKCPHRIFLLGTFLGHLPSTSIVVTMCSALGKTDRDVAIQQAGYGMLGLLVVGTIVILIRKKMKERNSGEAL